jgi:phage terminase small subunit
VQQETAVTLAQPEHSAKLAQRVLPDPKETLVQLATPVQMALLERQVPEEIPVILGHEEN